MLTLYTKERLSRPELAKIENDKAPPRKVPSIDALLMLKPDELDFDDDYSGSDISDPFEDVKNPDNMKKRFENLRKRLNRYEENLQVMASFSDDYKKAMEETRKNMEMNLSLNYESMADVNKKLEEARPSKEISESLKEKLQKIFRDEEYLNCGSDLDIPDREDNDEIEEKNTDVDIRNKLDTSEELIASPPGFNAYKHLSTNLSNKQNIPWGVMDNARSKCENWLEKNNRKVKQTKK